MLKLALVRRNDMLPADVRMLLPVHDSLLMEVPERMVEKTRWIVTEVMESMPAGFSAPLKVPDKERPLGR